MNNDDLIGLSESDPRDRKLNFGLKSKSKFTEGEVLKLDQKGKVRHSKHRAARVQKFVHKHKKKRKR